MTDRPPALKPLPDVLDAVALHDDLEEFEAMDPAALDRELAEMGYDEARLTERIAAAREEASAEPLPVAVPAPLAAPPAPVIHLQSRRPKPVPVTRWVPFLAAAAVALLVGGAASHRASTWMPARTVDYPTYVAPLSPEERVAPLRRRGLRSCTLGYYGECQDDLDEAKKIDPEGEKSAAVEAARRSIAEDAAAKEQRLSGQKDAVPKPPTNPSPGGAYAKPRPGWMDRPLQHHP